MNVKDVFTTITPIRSYEGVVSQIQEAIFSGRLQNGERLASERELCAIFNVSRPTLREALRWLEAIGLIEVRLGVQGGIYVVHPNPGYAGSAIEALLHFHEVTPRELEEFRASFEGETASWAAQRADADDLNKLTSIIQEIQASADQNDLPWSIISELDLQFHKAIAEASKNRVRVAIMLSVNNAIKRASLSLDSLMSPDERRSIAAELSGVVEALRTRNAELARQRMRDHVQRFSSLEASVISDDPTEEEPSEA